MAGNNTLKAYSFDTLQDYFQYILDSIVNGQIKQAKSLYKKLSGTQKTDLYKWADDNNISLKQLY